MRPRHFTEEYEPFEEIDHLHESLQ